MSSPRLQKSPSSPDDRTHHSPGFKKRGHPWAIWEFDFPGFKKIRCLLTTKSFIRQTWKDLFSSDDRRIWSTRIHRLSWNDGTVWFSRLQMWNHSAEWMLHTPVSSRLRGEKRYIGFERYESLIHQISRRFVIFKWENPFILRTSKRFVIFQ
jgi:hypothetical protein